MSLKAVIMAGGRGERFWPLSRRRFPKQLISFDGENSLLQQTVSRIEPLIPDRNIYVVVNEHIKHEVYGQLPMIPVENIIVEPLGKNTAPCIALSALKLYRVDPEAVMVVLPADHVIKDEEGFLRALSVGADIAREGYLVTLGIKPTTPRTGYGYIQQGEPFRENGDFIVRSVEKFVEKPSYEKAVEYIRDGNYLWNGGIFVWKASVILEEIRDFLPSLYAGMERIEEVLGTENEDEVVRTVYARLEPISIDYGVMERTKKAMVIPIDVGWSDIGNWSALDEVYEKDDNGNVVLGEHIGLFTRGCIIKSKTKPIITYGIDDIVIVEDNDVILVIPRAKVDGLKHILKEMDRRGYKELL
ncbi:MAG: mannose-1-phosphate guanylyltransferase [Synergistetes bacterium]|nr:mannose-1-phosphate guanylyltransferase [Synergistota bacterium]